MSETITSLVPESAVERAMVARGWADIDRAERLGPSNSGQVDVASIQAGSERARRWYRPPVTDPVPAGMAAMYQTDSGMVRYRRTADFLTPGERVFEVGIGMGFLATMMLREGLDRYRGVDLAEGNVTRTRKMLEANGFADIADARMHDLYQITREDVGAIDATLLVCCEVVEHVPDPETAVATLARALPDGADLLFSVPLLGRLEDVWGHGQAFGAARIHRMLEDAGLVAHHVEALHNTWALVLASRSTSPSPRAAAVLEKEAPAEPHRFIEAPFESMANEPVAGLPRADSSWTRRVQDVRIEPGSSSGDPQGSSGMRVLATCAPITRGLGRGWRSYAGVAFDVPSGTKGVRLEVGVADLDDVDSMNVEFRANGKRTGLWTWKPGERRPNKRTPTFLIAPGRSGPVLRRTSGSSAGADTVEVCVRAKGHHPIDFHLRRWAWVS